MAETIKAKAINFTGSLRILSNTAICEYARQDASGIIDSLEITTFLSVNHVT